MAQHRRSTPRWLVATALASLAGCLPGCASEPREAPACDISSCHEGCCISGLCVESSAFTCGLKGSACIDCTDGIATDTCGFGGRCVCGGTGRACGSTEACVDGQCVDCLVTCCPECDGKCAGSSDGCNGTCTANDCDGCCDEAHVCRAASVQDDAHCGAGGEACVSCTLLGKRCIAPAQICCQPNCAGKCGGPDECGGSCPNTCVGPSTCGGGGTTNVCGCTPSCAGRCGGDNGCGGTCPDVCMSPQTCGGAGTPNVCGCAPSCTGKCAGAVDGCGSTCPSSDPSCCCTGTVCTPKCPFGVGGTCCAAGTVCLSPSEGFGPAAPFMCCPSSDACGTPYTINADCCMSDEVCNTPYYRCDPL